MKELLEYRKQLVARLVSASKEFRDACLAVNDPQTVIDDWSIHQLAVHTRDVHKLVYGLRTQRTAQEDNPEFKNFDDEAYMAEHYSVDEPLADILDDLVADVKSLSEMLAALSVEAWSRISHHAAFGNGFTLQTWVERDLAHIEEHLESVKKVL